MAIDREEECEAAISGHGVKEAIIPEQFMPRHIVLSLIECPGSNVRLIVVIYRVYALIFYSNKAVLHS